MKKNLLLFLILMPLVAFSQSTFNVTYDFIDNLSATVTGADVIDAGLAVAGGDKLTSIGLVNDGGATSFQSHIVNNNNTSYNQTNMRFDITPKAGNTIRISKITVTQRSSKAGVAGQSQTYLFRIGCAMNGAVPINSDSEQSTTNTLFYDTYHADFFVPGTSVNSAGGDDYLSVWLTARGQSTSNDEFDWFVDKVEIEGNYVTVLALPEFAVDYSFDAGSTAPAITGNHVSASNITADGADSGLSAAGKIWVKTNSNTNSIGYKLMGLYCDVTPDAGYEVVLKQYVYTHAGSGVAGESRVNRVGIYRDASRSASGVLAIKDDFTNYTGRDVYGDNVNAGNMKVSTIDDSFSFDTQHFFTFSVNRVGDPEQSEYWTVDDLKIVGYIIPAGRSELLTSLIYGQEQLTRAVIGTGLGEYVENVYNTYQSILVDATAKLNDAAATQSEIDALTIEVNTSNEQFLIDANQRVATMTVDEASGHELIEGMSGYNSRLADSGWSFKNPEWQQAMDTLNAGWLRYMSGTRNNAFNMNIGLYEVEDLEQFIENGVLEDGHATCHKRVEAKGPQTVYDLYQGLGNVNSRLVVTWSGFIGEPWEVALFAKFCKDNHIEVDLWQFANEPYFYVPSRDSYFWNGGTDFARKMHPIADSIKAYFPDAVLAPNASWDEANNSFSKGIANYTPRFYNAFSKHTYAAYNTDASTPLATAVKELVGGVYYAGTESFPLITSTFGNDIPVYVTESGTWNTISKDIIMGGIYMSEYILRMSAHSNTKLVAKHSINSAAGPINNYSSALDNAYAAGTTLNGVDELECGIELTMEGMGQRIVNHGINKCNFAYQTSITGDVLVEADNKKTSVTQVPALFGGVYKGVNGKRYLLMTNKSDVPHRLDVQGLAMPSTVKITYVSAPSATTTYGQIVEKTSQALSSNLIIRPYSINCIEWEAEQVAPSASRIYDVKINSGEVTLKWWTKDNADSYVVYYGTDVANLNQSVEVSGKETNSSTITGLSAGTRYYFAVAGKNSNGVGVLSKVVDAKMAVPGKPYLVSANGRTESRLGGIITLLWRSVPDAHGYKVMYGTSSGVYTNTVDAGNVSGFRLSNLPVNQTYYIKIVAYNGYGESMESNELSATTVDMRPVAPHQVRLSENTSNGELTIQWENSLDYANGATYDIYRSNKVYTDYELVEQGVSGTSHTFNPNEKPGLWFYTVKSKNANGESFYSSNKFTITTTFDTWSPSGINDVNDFDYQVNIYPVPAKDFLNVEIQKYPEEVMYQLIGISGTSFKEGRFTYSEQVDISDLSSGIYVLVIKTNEGMFQQKIYIRK